MHLAHPLLFLSLFSSAGLADKGWVGSYISPDCKGPVSVGDAKNLEPTNVNDAKGQCYKWTPSTDPAAQHVGISFGSGWDWFQAVRFYEDDHCGHSNRASDYFHQDNGGKGVVCLKRQQVLPYKSFRALHDPQWNGQNDDH